MSLPARSTVTSVPDAEGGRRRRLEELFATYGTRVYAFARRRGSATDAEDVVSDTFLVAWRRLDAIPAEPLPWLLNVARNALANRQRGAARQEALRVRLAVIDRPPSRTPDVPSDDLTAQVVRALASLPRAEYDAITLIAWDGLTPDEVATVLGCSRAAVYLRTSRARRPERPRRRVWHVAATFAVVGAGTTATAFATGVLGGPAPEPVKEHLAELDRGMPADLRYDADLEHTRAVAATASGVLYLADTRDGGYCIEVVSETDRPRGAICLTGAQVGVRPIEVTAPLPDSDTSPLLVGGRADDDRVAAIRVRYADGTVTDVPFGTDRAWLLEVPATQQASALAQGLTIVGVDAAGAKVDDVTVPPLRDDDPLGTRHDAEQRLVSSTISDGDDFRLVLGIEGDVNVARPPRLTLHYPDGTTVRVPLAEDGSFALMLPERRTDDFADQAGRLVVTREGEVIAKTTVASVAYWRAHNR